MDNIKKNEIKKILLVKKGALGDVVRTSYFAAPLKKKFHNASIYWYTAESSNNIIRFNPYIDFVINDLKDAKDVAFDIVFSLDDELETLKEVSNLKFKEIVGAFLENEKISYTKQSAYWFDMGLISKHGKCTADSLKKKNVLAHSEIFKKIFEVDSIDLCFYNSCVIDTSVAEKISNIKKDTRVVGLNLFAGKRWPSKSYNEKLIPELISKLSGIRSGGKKCTFVILGESGDQKKLIDAFEIVAPDVPFTAIETSGNILTLASVVKNLDCLVTSDSLSLHLAVAQKTPVIAFFTSTSAAEIENETNVFKLISDAEDYCSYKKDARNDTIKPDLIVGRLTRVLDGSK